MQISQETIRQMDLLRLLVDKEITLRYKRTYLGILWSLLNPLLTGLVLIIAFTVFMRVGIEHFPLFLLAALFPWIWFSTSVTIAANTLSGNVSLIRKVVFPKHFLLLAMITAQLVNFVFALPILIGLAFYYGSPPTLVWLVGIPLLAAVQFAIVYGLALIVSVVSVFVRDFEHMVLVVIGLLFWMTPIVYPLEAVPQEYRVFLTLNPVTYLIQSWREVFFNNTLNWYSISVSMVTAAVVMIIGLLTFRKLERRLDEVL